MPKLESIIYGGAYDAWNLHTPERSSKKLYEFIKAAEKIIIFRLVGSPSTPRGFNNWKDDIRQLVSEVKESPVIRIGRLEKRVYAFVGTKGRSVVFRIQQKASDTDAFCEYTMHENVECKDIDQIIEECLPAYRCEVSKMAPWPPLVEAIRHIPDRAGIGMTSERMLLLNCYGKAVTAEENVRGLLDEFGILNIAGPTPGSTSALKRKIERLRLPDLHDKLVKLKENLDSLISNVNKAKNVIDTGTCYPDANEYWHCVAKPDLENVVARELRSLSRLHSMNGPAVGAKLAIKRLEEGKEQLFSEIEQIHRAEFPSARLNQLYPSSNRDKLRYYIDPSYVVQRIEAITGINSTARALLADMP